MNYKKEAYLFVAYFFGNGFMLVNNGVIWEDWTVFDMESAGLAQQFGENGFGFMVPVHRALNGSIYSPLLYHWLSFFLLFGAYVFIHRILKQFSVDENSAFLTTLLAMLAPYYETKNLMICMPYALFLLSFCWGLYLVFGYYEGRREIKGLVAGVLLLFFSFFLNSLIPMFLCVYTLFFFVSNDFSMAAFKSKSRHYLFLLGGLLFLPFLFWVFKKAFFPVKGLYASSGYNVINLSIKELPSQLKMVFMENVVGIYDEFVRLLVYDVDFGLFAIVASAAVCALVLRRSSFKTGCNKNIFRYALAGMILFFVGAFPYLIVGKLPRYFVYDTRHQILLSIGVALFTYALVISLPLILRKTAYFVFLLTFLVNTVSGNINFLRGWIKIEALQHDIRKLDMGGGGTILTTGFDGQLNATENPLTFYELSGIFKSTLGRQDCFFVHNKHAKAIINMTPGILEHAKKFNMRDYKTTDPSGVKTLGVKYNTQKMAYFDVLISTKLYYGKKEMFQMNIDSILSVEIK
ncbi:hypothetical protein [Pricia sp.]|uniref:hypothetical protein n=1 Tax=Pricia sp. TaxID=2268138 RepID=UPI0035932FF7